jgi:diguanylate cyclase (GGDEF)-like protein
VIAVIAETDPAVRELVADVLSGARWEVHGTADPDEAVAVCRRTEAEVLMIGEHVAGGAPELLDRVKRDGELFLTNVIMLGADLDVGDVRAWTDRGAYDVLRTPPTAADVLARAKAALRAKALVKELTKQNERLEELVYFDGLTRLRTRRAVLNELEMLLAGSRRHQHVLSVLMLDVDHFKTINDRSGHRAGDEVLQEVSRRLRERLRREDVAGRLGGDELLVVLPSTDGEGAQTVAESIRAAINATPVETSAGPIEVTVSVGTAAWDGEQLDALLERADRALYSAKEGGRDSVSAS